MKEFTVAVTVPIFPNVLQTYVLSQLVAFRRMGLNTLVIAGKQGVDKEFPPAIDKYRLLDSTIYICSDPAHIPGELLSLPLGNSLYRRALNLIFASKIWEKRGWKYFLKEIILAKALAFREFDVIHSHSLVTSYQHLFFKELFSVPIVTTFHGKEPRSSNNLPLEKARVVFSESDAFLVNTEFAKSLLLEMGCPTDKIHIIPQGTNLEDFPFRERYIEQGNKIILLTVSRLSIEKGHHIAIKAVAELAEDFPNLEYHLVGSGPEKDNLITLISELDVGNQVMLHGLKVGDKLKQFYTNAHIFVLPSIDTRDGYAVETQGVVLQEAQACGIPVIGSRTGGIPDVISDTKTGLLYDEGDHKNLADKLRILIQDSVLYKKLSSSGREEVENRFDTNLVSARIISLYEHVLEHSGSVQ